MKRKPKTKNQLLKETKIRSFDMKTGTYIHENKKLKAKEKEIKQTLKERYC